MTQQKYIPFSMGHTSGFIGLLCLFEIATDQFLSTRGVNLSVFAAVCLSSGGNNLANAFLTPYGAPGTIGIFDRLCYFPVLTTVRKTDRQNKSFKIKRDKLKTDKQWPFLLYTTTEIGNKLLATERYKLGRAKHSPDLNHGIVIG
jgi:hypothetical protein